MKLPVLALGALFAAAAAAASGPKMIGKCRPGADTKFVARCATASLSNAEPYGMNWKTQSDDNKKKIVTGNTSGVKVEDVDPANGKVQISYEYEEKSNLAWVNADTLDCDPAKNLSSYVLPDPEETVSTCREEYALFKGKAVKQYTALSEAQSTALVDRALGYGYAFQRKVEGDLAALTKAYEKITGDEKVRRISKMRKELAALKTRATAAFGDDCETPDSASLRLKLKRNTSSAIEAQRSCHVIIDAVALLDESFPKDLRGDGVLAKSFDQFMTQTEVSEGENNTNDDLSRRMMLLYGLPDEMRARSFSKLSLKRENREMSRVDGIDAAIPMLHNGYVYGGAADLEDESSFGRGVDCSHFLYDIFSKRKGGVISSSELQKIAAYHETGSKRKYTPNAECFQLVDLRKGSPPQPADFVTIPGHVVMVRSYDAATGNIKTVEAAGNVTNTITSKTRPIFDPPCIGASTDQSVWDVRPVHAGVKVLRFIGHSANSKCPVDFSE